VKGNLGATYFVAKTVLSGYELWSTDGAGASLVTDYNPGTGDGVRRQ
jgi:ELWxxDGT repeat protein